MEIEKSLSVTIVVEADLGENCQWILRLTGGLFYEEDDITMNLEYLIT